MIFMPFGLVEDTPICFTFLHLAVCNVSERLSLERFACNFILDTCMEIFLRNLNLVKIKQKLGTLYTKTEVRHNGSGDIESV